MTDTPKPGDIHGLAERDEARKELVALRVLDGAPAGRAETERDEAREEQR